MPNHYFQSMLFCRYYRRSGAAVFFSSVRARVIVCLLVTFWPRATLKGPKRSFVVVVLLLGLETWVKNGTKNVMKGTKNVRERVSHFLSFFCRISRPCMAFSDLVWSCMAFLWSCMALYGRFIIVYGLLWQNIDLIGLVSFFLAVIDPN